MSYNKLLYKQCKSKYILFNVINIILSFIMAIGIIKGLLEKERLPLIFYIAVVQVITVIRYFITRKLYMQELYIINEDENNTSFIKNKTKFNVFINKFKQLIIFQGIHYFLGIIIAMIIKNNWSIVMVILQAYLIGIVLTMIAYLFDIKYLNDIKNNLIDNILEVVLALGIGIIFYYPSTMGALLYSMVLVVTMVINVFRIRKVLYY